MREAGWGKAPSPVLPPRPARGGEGGVRGSHPRGTPLAIRAGTRWGRQAHRPASPSPVHHPLTLPSPPHAWGRGMRMGTGGKSARMSPRLPSLRLGSQSADRPTSPFSRPQDGRRWPTGRMRAGSARRPFDTGLAARGPHPPCRGPSPIAAQREKGLAGRARGCPPLPSLRRKPEPSSV